MKKLYDQQARNEVFEMYVKGIKPLQISKDLGINYGTTRSIIRQECKRRNRPEEKKYHYVDGTKEDKKVAENVHNIRKAKSIFDSLKPGTLVNISYIEDSKPLITVVESGEITQKSDFAIYVKLDNDRTVCVPKYQILTREMVIKEVC